MKKDILIGEVNDIAIAIVPEKQGKDDVQWTVYFLNLKNNAVENVLITAQGKGIIDGEERQTATMRFFLNTVEAGSAKSIELIMPEAFALTNQYWVSFYERGQIYDKRYVFDPNSVSDERLEEVPVLKRPGVFVR